MPEVSTGMTGLEVVNFILNNGLLQEEVRIAGCGETGIDLEVNSSISEILIVPHEETEEHHAMIVIEKEITE